LLGSYFFEVGAIGASDDLAAVTSTGGDMLNFLLLSIRYQYESNVLLNLVILFPVFGVFLFLTYIIFTGYMEHVLSPSEISQNRRFYTPHVHDIQHSSSLSENTKSSRSVIKMTIGVGDETTVVSDQKISPSSAASNSLLSSNSVYSATHSKKRICIWTSDTMDGQKNIWLQQMLNLKKVIIYHVLHYCNIISILIKQKLLTITCTLIDSFLRVNMSSLVLYPIM
jgi:hypothetical protein